MGKLASGLGKGLILSAVEMAGSWAINKAFDVTPEREAKARENIHAGADEFYKDMHLPRPQWPSLVSEAHGEPTRPLEVAKDKADAAGAALKAGLDVTLTPTIDLSCFDALDARLAKATRGFKEFAAAAKSAAGAAAHSIRHGYQPGSHALHDGSELY